MSNKFNKLLTSDISLLAYQYGKLIQLLVYVPSTHAIANNTRLISALTGYEPATSINLTPVGVSSMADTNKVYNATFSHQTGELTINVSQTLNGITLMGIYMIE